MRALPLVLVLVAPLTGAAVASSFESDAAQDVSALTAQSRAAGARITADSSEMGRTLMQSAGDHDRGGRDHDRGRDWDHGRDRGWDQDHDRDHWRDNDRDHDRTRDRWRNDGPKGPYYNPPDTVVLPAHRDWSRWKGHPGWGHGSGWGWRGDRPLWWGWLPYKAAAGSTHASCEAYYNGQANDCRGDCLGANSVCFDNCAAVAGYSDTACVQQCGVNYNFCTDQCAADHDALVGRCPQ